MGKSYTPKYIVETEYSTPHIDVGGRGTWAVKEYGAPTTENLEAWRVAMNASFKPGGTNAVTEGIIPHISKARILTNRHIGRHRGWTPTTVRVVVAETTMPMFEVV
jgi:hypothetical protein